MKPYKPLPPVLVPGPISMYLQNAMLNRICVSASFATTPVHSLSANRKLEDFVKFIETGKEETPDSRSAPGGEDHDEL